MRKLYVCMSVFYSFLRRHVDSKNATIIIRVLLFQRKTALYFISNIFRNFQYLFLCVKKIIEKLEKVYGTFVVDIRYVIILDIST